MTTSVDLPLYDEPILEEDTIQKEGLWCLVDNPGYYGPVIKHVPCVLKIYDLNRKYPMCRKCGELIPLSMISSFTFLNWKQVDDYKYFIPFEYEDDDFIHNGHLRHKLKKLPYEIIKHYLNAYNRMIEQGETVNTTITWFKLGNSENEDITHFCGGSLDNKKNNKPKDTQVAITNWFNPTTFDEETKIYTCKACGDTHKSDESIIIIGE